MRKLFRLFLLIFLIAILDAEGKTPSYTNIEDLAKIKVATPSLSQRRILKIRLNNGLEAYLISDPNADQSGAAMTVKTGSWEDPKESPGMAHFLEHMLFLGTKKFPGESEYERYIFEHGGTTNAFTSNEFTAYLFAINHNAFPEALDRFSSFFKEPLFNPSGVDRELQAIDQEYAKNIEDDDFRQLFVHKALANPTHPHHLFSMGNKASLSHVSQESLKQWYQQHYSANQMRLIVLSNEPIYELAERVAKDFSEIPSFNKEPFAIEKPVSPEELKGSFISIVPHKNIRKLTLLWEMPPQFADKRDFQPDALICYILGHEGEGSLYAELKKDKFADALSCGSARMGPKDLNFFVEIDLTPLGIEHVLTVIEKTFQTIAMIRKEGISQALFNEIQQLQKIDYQNQSREDEFKMLMKQAIWIANEEVSTFPEQSLIIQKFDPKLVQEFLSYMTPQNSIIDLVAPEEYLENKPEQKEPWMGVEYSVKKIPAEQLESWAGAEPNPSIHLPAPNPYVPDNLTLYRKPAVQSSLLPIPKVMIDNDRGKFFFAQDSRYAVPRISWNFEIKTPEIENGNAVKVVLGDLYIRAARDAINSEVYLASLAGLYLDLERTNNGIAIHINGYNEKAPLLLNNVLTALKDLKVPPIKFRIYKEALLRQYQNAAAESPLKQVIELFRSVIFKNFTTNKEKAAAIKKQTDAKFKEFIDKIFNKVYVEGLLYGNQTESQALSVSHKVLEYFDKKIYPKEEHLQTKLIVLPEEKGPFYAESPATTQGSAVFLGIQDFPFTFESYVTQQLLMQAMKEPFFSTLRTKQQTGYIVYSSSEEIEKFLFNCFIVQSNTHDGRDLLARFELFIEDFLQEITKETLPLERFEKIRESILTSLKQPPKNIVEMGELLTSLAFKYEGDFSWLDNQIKALEELTYPKFLEHVYKTMGKQNKRRLAIFLKGNLSEAATLQYKRVGSLSQARQLGTYKDAFKLTD